RVRLADVQQIDQRGAHDQRQHQQRVRVERETARGDRRNTPLAPRTHVYTSYLASVAAAGSENAVARDTTYISRTETSVIGTTGSSPNTVVPAAIRAMTSVPPIDQTGMAVPGRGAGTTACSPATPSTAAAVHTVTASAPQRVLFFQKSAATSSGDSAEETANEYWLEVSKIELRDHSEIA